VCFVGKRSLVREALPGEVPAGVVSCSASIQGNSAEAGWHRMYERDLEGALVYDTIYEERQVPLTNLVDEEVDEETEEIVDGQRVYLRRKVRKAVERCISKQARILDEQGGEVGREYRPVLTTG